MREWMNSWTWKGWLLGLAIFLYVMYGIHGLLTESSQERYDRRIEDGDSSYSR